MTQGIKSVEKYCVHVIGFSKKDLLCRFLKCSWMNNIYAPVEVSCIQHWMDILESSTQLDRLTN